MKILLEENRSVKSTNRENHVDTDLTIKMKLLPNENLSDNFSLYDQYNRERDECDRYRFILNINPVCTNALFNVKTEININEGKLSSNCISVIDESNGVQKNQYARKAVNSTNPIKYIDAIRNTEYSHEENGNFEYHCGVDIFNNHIIRSTNFTHVNKIGKDAQESYPVYNTIADYARNANGGYINDNFSPLYSGGSDTHSHMYTTDSLLNLKTAFNEKCREKDGWWGFVNPSYININTSSSDTITVNRLINNKKACEFIDLYPDRSLFSFIPKYNKYQSRIENNWDYCITYPYKNDYELVNKVCDNEKQAIKCDVKKTVNGSSVEVLVCKSVFKHNLKVGDNVNIYYYFKPEDGERSFYCYSSYVKVVNIGDMTGNFKDRVFCIRYNDVKSIYDYIKDNLYFKKVVANTECSYYCRKFKKIKTKDNKDLRSDINKAAFSKNIYGDDISQLIFIDDVDISGLCDNNGRDLSEVYFTVVKRHKGNNEWYSETSPRFSGTDIEYSHCFGKVTSGLDFSGIGDEEEPFDYNIHKLHNLDIESTRVQCDNDALRTFSAWGDSVVEMPAVIEDDITIDFDEFYGDIVEMDNYDYTETVLSNVCHRFNTQQRESFNNHYKNIYQDIITIDDYDIGMGGRSNNFTYETYYVNDTTSSRNIATAISDTLIYGNIMPEGYFYNPFTRIKLKEEDANAKYSDAKYINYEWCSIEGRPVLLEYEIRNGIRVLVGKRYDFNPNWYNNGNQGGGRGNDRSATEPEPQNVAHTFELSTDGYLLKVLVPTDYEFIKGDYIALYDKENNNIIWGEIVSFSSESMIMEIYFQSGAFGSGIDILSHEDYFYPGNLNRKYFLFWSSNSVPSYAKLSINSRKFCWRRTIKQSNLTNNSELYDMPFSNGRLYIQKNINFFLKRQDPDGKYGLSIPIHFNTGLVYNPMVNYLVEGYGRVNLDQFASIIENNKICY